MAQSEQKEQIPSVPYSKGLINALKFGEDAARKLNHTYLQSENFFLGLLQDESVLEALKQLNIDPKMIDVAREVVKEFTAFINPGGYKEPNRAISPTPHLNKILELSNIESSQANAKETNSIHALIGTILVKGRSIINISATLEMIGITDEDLPGLREKAKELDSKPAA